MEPIVMTKFGSTGFREAFEGLRKFPTGDENLGDEEEGRGADGDYGAAKGDAESGTGVIAGGAVPVVLELAGVENALGKELGSKNPLNNARAVIEAVGKMNQFRDVARERGIPMEELWK